MSEVTYDLVTIGGGMAGYASAIRASQLGMKVACVEKRNKLGGTCLNVGCIPSKALLHSSELYEQAVHGHKHGMTGDIGLDLAALMTRTDEVVDGLTKDVEWLFKKNKIDHFIGSAVISAPDKVDVTTSDRKSLQLKSRLCSIIRRKPATSFDNILLDFGTTYVNGFIAPNFAHLIANAPVSE